ncbi:lactate dehydrogenase [Sphingobacterium lactis]|uniref:lactate dehydrogenase n=1 Tax=Sphingobacterium lactis TaxID=797291 RepID=UPI003DA4C41B
MRVIAYNILGSEKEHLARANGKVHDLTLISNELNFSTMHYAMGKEAVIISDRDVLDRIMLFELSKLGVKNIVTRSKTTDHIDLDYAGQLKMHVANVPFETTPENVAKQAILNLTQWMVGGCAGEACQCRMDCTNKVKIGQHHGK